MNYRVASKGEQCASKGEHFRSGGLEEAGAERRPPEGPPDRQPALARPARRPRLRRREKHYRQLAHRLGAPLIREVLVAFRRADVSAGTAADKLGLGRTRFYQLYADYLRACARQQEHDWTPATSGGDHAPDWPHGTEPLLRKLLATKPPAPMSKESQTTPAPTTEQPTALKQAIAKVEGLKENLKAMLTDLNDVLKVLHVAQREQRVSEKEVEEVRAALEAVKKLRL